MTSGPPTTIGAAPRPPDAAAVAAAFDLGRPVGEPVVAARGELGRIWRVDTDRGRWAVKELLDPMSEAEAAADVRFQEAAISAGIPMPSPVRRPTDDVLAELPHGDGTRWFRVYTWVDLVPGIVEAEVAGELLARTHRVVVPSTGPVHPWFTAPVEDAAWEAVARQVRDVAPAWGAAYLALLPEVIAAQRLLALPPWTPDRWCHLDFNPYNVLRSADGSAVVVDWENADAGHVDQELGMAVLDFGLDDDVEAQRFLDGYRRCDGPGTLREPADFRVAIAVYGHLFERYAQNAVDAAADPEDRGRAGHWIVEMLGSPITLQRIDRLLTAIRS